MSFSDVIDSLYQASLAIPDMHCLARLAGASAAPLRFARISNCDLSTAQAPYHHGTVPMSMFTKHRYHRLMGSLRQREPRRTVILKARMRDADGWRDVAICNLSSRGLMAKCSALPAKGAYIELRYRHVCIVGRVAWAQGSRFGVRTQDKIDIDSLLDESLVKGVRTREADRTTPPHHPAARSAPDLSAQVAASRRFARLFDWSIVVLGSVLAAIFIFGAASTALKTPMQKVGAALAGGKP